MPPIPAPTAAAERMAQALPWLVLLVGFLVAAAGVRWLQDEQVADAEAEFRHGLTRVSAEIADRFHRPLYGLASATRGAAARDAADRLALEPSPAAPMVADAFPGLIGLGIVARVSASDFADDHPADGEGTGSPDLAADPVRRAAARQALESGQPTLSGAIPLAGERSSGPGMLLLLPLPVRSTGGTADTTPAGPQSLLVATLALDDLLAGLQAPGGGELHVRLFDSDNDPPTGTLLFDSAAGVAAARAGDASRHRAVGVLTLPGRRVTVELLSTPAFEARTASQAPERFAAGAVGTALLLALLLHQQVGGRRRAEALARQMAADLERLAGHGAREVVGPPADRRPPMAPADPATMRHPRARVDAGQGFGGERLARGTSRTVAAGGVPPAARGHVGSSRPRRLEGLRLLVAEDDVDQQQVVRRLLEAEGAEVHIADDGAEAVCAVAVAAHPFDGVLMDLQMPVMDGFTATARIRQDLRLIALPIVAVTTLELAGDRTACLAAGLSGQLAKPLDPEALVAMLCRLTGREVAEAAGRP